MPTRSSCMISPLRFAQVWYKYATRLPISMFYTASVVLLSLGISTVVRVAAAVPLTNSACSIFPTGSPSLSSTFHLAALNTTLANSNRTGAPIVPGPLLVHNADVYFNLVTYESNSFTSNPDFALTLTNGILSAGARTWSYDVSNNSSPAFVETSAGNPAPIPVYCAVTTPGYDHPILAANGHADLFSICQNANVDGGLFYVYYNVSSSQFGGPDLSTCYTVALQMVPSS